MTYYICHSSEHVRNQRDCTKVPYGTLGLYDVTCNSHPLTLVGLIEDKLPGQLPDEWICRNAEHIRKRVSCAMMGHRRTASDSYGKTDHEWVRFYKKNDFVLARGQLDSSFMPSVNREFVSVLFRPGNVSKWVPLDAIVGLTVKPVPDEPDRKSILRSQKNGWLVTFRDGCWRSDEDATGMDWADVFENYGPFDEFTPSGEIK